MAAERRALIVGINYVGAQQGQLRGCINDAEFMAQALVRSGYDVLVLRDDVQSRMPTALRIVMELLQLVSWACAGSGREIFFHFSGHGVGIADTTGEETDGRDECMVSCDDVVIRDDTLNALLRMLPKDATATLVVDCCHSGTMADLPYRMDHGAASTTPIAAKVMLLSGCKDAQTSADAIDVRPEYQCYSGAMTSTLLFCLRYARTWRQLLSLMRFVLRRRRFTQVPQLSASFEITSEHPLTAFAPL